MNVCFCGDISNTPFNTFWLNVLPCEYKCLWLYYSLKSEQVQRNCVAEYIVVFLVYELEHCQMKKKMELHCLLEDVSQLSLM